MKVKVRRTLAMKNEKERREMVLDLWKSVFFVKTIEGHFERTMDEPLILRTILGDFSFIIIIIINKIKESETKIMVQSLEL